MLVAKIYEGKDGRLIYKRVDGQGKRRQIKSRVGEKRKDFEKRCQELDQELSVLEVGLKSLGPLPTKLKAHTLDELFSLWHENYVKTKLSAAEVRSTRHIYERYLKKSLGQVPLDQVTRLMVYSLLNEADQEGVSPSTLKKVKGLISRMYNFAINDLGENLTSPVEGLRFTAKKRPQTSKKIMRKEDFDRFMTVTNPYLFDRYYELLYYTGLRPSEALGLKATDYDKDFLYIRRAITIDGYSPLKTKGSFRKIPLTEKIRDILKAQERKVRRFHPFEDYLFSKNPVGPPTMTALKLDFERTKARYKAKYKTTFDFSLYSFRHSFATQMAENEMPIKTLQAIMGHSNVQTTMHYYVEATDQMILSGKDFMDQLLTP